MAYECHLLAGDARYSLASIVRSKLRLGQEERLVVQVTHPKERQRYFGALNAKSGELLHSQAEYANSNTTVDFLETLREHYPNKRLWVIWNSASYHKSQKVKAYLRKVYNQLLEKDGPLMLLQFAPNAPEQNSVGAVWLQGKTEFRGQAGLNCFSKVKQFFTETIKQQTYSFDKFD